MQISGCPLFLLSCDISQQRIEGPFSISHLYLQVAPPHMLRRLYFDIGTMYLFAIWIMYLLYFKLCILKIRICANTRLSPVTYCFLIRSDNNGSRRAKFFPPTIPHSAKWKSQKGRWMLMGVFMDLWFLYLFLQKSQKGQWMLLFVFMFLCLWYFCFQKKSKGLSVSLPYLSWNIETSAVQSCKNVPTVPTSWCYFFWPVLIFGKSTRKTVLLCHFFGKSTRKTVLLCRFFGANFFGGKIGRC